MVSTHLDFALQKLDGLELEWSIYSMPVQLHHLQMELRFLKRFVCCCENWACIGNEDVHLGSFMSRMDLTLQEIVYDYKNCKTFANQLLQVVEHFKPEIKEICLDLLDSSFIHRKSSTSDEISNIICTIFWNLQEIFDSKAHMIVSVKEQINALADNLEFFASLVNLSAEGCTCPDEELRDFRVQVHAWTNKLACLSFLYWVNQLEEEAVPKLNVIYLDVLQQIKPCSPEAIRNFLGVLKTLKSSRSDFFLMGDLVVSSVDMLLGDRMASMEDSFRMALCDGLVILITFLMDPPAECGKDGNEIRAKADVVIDEAASLFSSPCVREKKEGIPNERDFLEKINILKAEIRENYVQIQDLPWFDFPRTNGLGFIDFLMGNLKARSIPFAKCLVLAMQEKLISLGLKDLMEQQNESEELKDLWMQIISVAYAMEHVVDLCFFGDNQIWYTMICLSIFLEKIEYAMTEVKKIRDEFVYNSGVGVEMNVSHTIPEYAKLDEVVGFKNESEAIIDQLIGGSQELQIISIVGMPGQGKTTLANKTYSDPSVKWHFHKIAWCFVSQVYQMKELLLEILRGVTVLDDEICKMSKEELAENLYRCLKGRRYLIIMDDIWDIEVWNQLKESFPNDKNGSRIMFTSRIHSIASQAELGSSTHLLHRLSAEESWELLEKKLFGKDGCPTCLLEVGLQIIEICEGLPLSIIVTSGILARRVKDLNWWKDTATNLNSKIVGEGCMNILELSYNHLPHNLKSCFLYFGAFQQGKAVRVQKLTQLWVVEGFIPIGTERPEDMAKDFLMDLIGRSLVIVVKRSSNGGIKECRLHDLLFDFCLVKVEEERFLKPLKDTRYPPNTKYEQYRLSMHSEWGPFVESNPTALYAHSLFVHPHGDFNFHPDDSSFFMKLKCLRVLDLYGVLFSRFPGKIISLIYLRYLAIEGISSLPQNIENLQNLEVLRVRGPEDFEVPATIWKMKRLRHICLRRAANFSIGNSVLEGVLEGVQLHNVDTLSSPLISRWEYQQQLLRRFPKVRSLKLQLQENDPQFLALDFLRNLESLKVNSFSGMYYPMEQYLPWSLKFPSTLKKLTLRGTNLPWNKISAIGKLPNLKVLKLRGDAFVGYTWDMEDEEFLNLKFLELQSSEIQQWNACTDPFPCLQRLVLVGCNKLEEIPSKFGDISTLNMIDVRSCSKEAGSSAKEILNEQQEMGNDGFVVLITRKC